MGKYCHSDAPELEARLEAFLERLAARIGALPESREIAAVLLGGGYGRGEGGFSANRTGTRSCSTISIFS